MSEILGLLLFAFLGILVLLKLAQALARESRRHDGPVDRVSVLHELVGVPEGWPHLRRTLEPRLTPDDSGLPTAHETQRRIGSVRIASAMKPCDEVVSISRKGI